MERIAQKAEIRCMEAVSDGPAPELHTDSEEEEPKETEEPIKPGDCIFAIGLSSTSRDLSHFKCFSALG